jgi:hypothetical protein
MRVKLDSSALSQTRWSEYAVRFFFGGCITAMAAVVAMKFGPVLGGVLLAFPAIFPAGATLIEKHETEKKQKAGLNGKARGRKAASIDAAGAAIGALGLLVFAFLMWRFLPQHGAWISIPAATAAWLGVSVLLWVARKHSHLGRKLRFEGRVIHARKR